MNGRFTFQISSPIILALIGLFYLSAPLPNDSPGCCTIENMLMASLNQVACDIPESSSCIEINLDGFTSGKKLCELYIPGSTSKESCSKTRIATCDIRNTVLEKIYYNTGSAPWDKNSASADCSTLGGELE